MLDDMQLNQLLQALPRLQVADAAVLRDLRRAAFFARVPAGKDVFALGDQVDAIALLLSGTIRVYRVSDTGREITLYRFSAGESCILTANAIINNEAFTAIATVEEAADAVMIPADAFRQWVDVHPLWRDFVFALLSQRLLSVMEIVDEVAFARMDSRVADFLLAAGRDVLHITHQEIAAELGSSREVISRILAGFAHQGIVELRRGTIEIVDMDALRAYR